MYTRYDYIIIIGKRRYVRLLFARICIFEAMIFPRFVPVSFMILQRHATFSRKSIYQFMDDIIVLMMNPNQYLAATFISFYLQGFLLLALLVYHHLKVMELIIYTSHLVLLPNKALAMVLNVWSHLNARVITFVVNKLNER